jgi:hypothetical protein
MNIAILIGISKYKSEAPLPACSHDVENMRRLLAATKKYDDIQLVHVNTNASQVKDALRQFFAKYQATAGIEEALIYFSGHGTYQNDAMLCCSDFDSNRPATTSISNGELDDLLRSAKPNVAVKIIDACQSGSPYIKDASAGFEKALSKSSLNSFICMASSRQDQQSYASAGESIFTAKWIDAALSKDNGSILYRDIQAALADAFVANPDQTPFFVSQGTGLEVFSTVTDEMKAILGARVKAITPEKPDTAVVQLIGEVVAKRDQAFVPHDQVLRAAEVSKEALIAHKIEDPIVVEFYTKTVRTDIKLVSIPKARAVAAFADEQSWPKRYFAKINQERYKERVLKERNLLMGVTALAYFKQPEEDEYTYVTKFRPASLEVTEALPFEVAELSFTSTRPSLPAFLVYIGIVHSLTEAMILSATVRLVQKGWETRAPELSDVQWRYQSYSWASIVEDPSRIWREAQQRGEADIRGFLESLLPKPDAELMNDGSAKASESSTGQVA